MCELIDNGIISTLLLPFNRSGEQSAPYVDRVWLATVRVMGLLA